MKEKRPIDSVAHRKDRKRYFAAHPLCERCERRGVIKPAYILHHRDRNQLNRSWNNLEALCNECHEVEHGRKIICGCDVNGLPLASGHGWNK